MPKRVRKGQVETRTTLVWHQSPWAWLLHLDCLSVTSIIKSWMENFLCVGTKAWEASGGHGTFRGWEAVDQNAERLEKSGNTAGGAQTA